MHINGFEWNEWNIEHIDQHDVTPQKVEEACYYQPFILKTRHGRYLILGQTQGGRYLATVIEYKGKGLAKTVTCRHMNDAERNRYIKER